jgi:hypothetical protein
MSDIEIFKTLFAYIKSEKKKPMLVFGPLQSGKKTMIRNALQKLKYVVWEPTTSNLENQYDMGIKGKHAFIMRMSEVGVKTLPNVKKAPVFYVCEDPYDYGLTKAELMARFEMFNMKTGRDYSNKEGNSERDTNPSFWDAINAINNYSSSFIKKLYYIERAGDYLPQVIYNSYLNGQKADKMTMAQAADALSMADAMFDTGGPEQYQVQQFSTILKVMLPTIATGITSRNLTIQSYKPSVKPLVPDANPLLAYHVMFPKSSQPVTVELPPPKTTTKRRAKAEPKPRKPRAPKKPKKEPPPPKEYFSL